MRASCAGRMTVCAFWATVNSRPKSTSWSTAPPNRRLPRLRSSAAASKCWRSSRSNRPSRKARMPNACWPKRAARSQRACPPNRKPKEKPTSQRAISRKLTRRRLKHLPARPKPRRQGRKNQRLIRGLKSLPRRATKSPRPRVRTAKATRAKAPPDPYILTALPGQVSGHDRTISRHIRSQGHGLGSGTTGSQSQLLRARQSRRTQGPYLVHARRATRLSARHLHSAARDRSIRLGADFPHPGRRHSRHVQYVLGRWHSPHGDLRPQYHAVHLGLDHHSADDDGLADARAAQERGRGRSQTDESVHPVSHRRPG